MTTESLLRLPVQSPQAAFFVFFARTIFPLLESYRVRLAPLYCPDHGRPAWDPVRLLGVLIRQYMLRMADRQAAEAVQYDPRWRWDLPRQAQDVTFDPSLLVLFRNRRLESGQERLALAAVLDYLVEQGWVPKRCRQRRDSTHVRGLRSQMSRLECTRQTLRWLADQRPRRLRPPATGVPGELSLGAIRAPPKHSRPADRRGA